MSNLRNLYIADNKVKSVEPISTLKRMVSLDLAGNTIEDIAPIGRLSGLKSLTLKGCEIKSLEFVRTLTLDFLMLNGNAISARNAKISTKN
jgi:Leucine-rich repeat (LRR) protein